jgi:thiol-disulfide isomerase/thioredoxin
MADAPELILYTSPGCCLCTRLLEQLAELESEVPFRLQVVNIDGDPNLEALYRTELPVLLLNGRKVVKYEVSTEALRQRLRRASGSGSWRDLLRLR